MTQTNNSTTQPLNKASLTKRLLLGAGIGLILIATFLYGVQHPRPEWGKLWMLRPLIVVPLAGATGGVVSYFLDHITYQGGWKRVLANILSLLIVIFGLWMGVVLGLSGTLWH